MTMFVSTIIPTVARDTLARAVVSVLDQDLAGEDFEVIVVNDSGAPLPSAPWQSSSRVRIVDTRRVVKGKRVDFVVVGPPGVFVIACGQPVDKERARAKQLMSLLDAMHAVVDIAGVRRDEVHPVLCMTGETPEDSWSRGVTVCSVSNLADTLMFKRERLMPDEVETAATAVARAMHGTGGRHRA